MYKQIRLGLAAIIVFFSLMTRASERPNIIVFLVDDMGWQDTSEPFWKELTPLNKRYRTPSMSRLASEGMKFTNAYACPVCTPTRTSLMSGMNAAHEGITNWTSPLKDRNTDNSDEQMAGASWNFNGLSPVPGIEKTIHATPFPELLKEAGYFTIHVGKAHWASQGTPGASPHHMGFMVNISGHAGGHPQSYLGEDNYGNIPGKAQPQAVPDLEEYFGTDTFLTEALTLEAIRAMEAPIRNKQPFFLNMCQYAVHTPIMADKRFVQKYYDAGLDPIEARYASLIEGMDKSLGDIMDYLEKMDVDRNTIIIFMSDNGGLSLTPPRGGEPFTHNLPLKAGKGSVYEGGIREPMIVKWPGVVQPKTVASQYVIVEDFFPTILQMAEVKDYKIVQPVDGKSFVPILENPEYSDTTRVLVWHSPNKWTRNDGPGINYFSAVRQGKWKLVYNMRNGKRELYNLDADIGELNDLSLQHPAKVKELSALISDRLREWNAPMPAFKSTGMRVPYPDEVSE
ncbi:sulfatase [Maribellus sp. CM-23]|uniref:sulfatase n=1 Tax=Maribellus sp. CM-23 TaxID=2781026 RepID=UPI001F26B60F|nr:sulfatase [Maribellus sp. CM-23]MCE4564948.1 sulfatase [Maribellus sp. CM-23]